MSHSPLTTAQIRRRTLLKLPLLGAAAPALLQRGLSRAESERTAEATKGLLRFAVIGDSGSGDTAQMLIARQMQSRFAVDPFAFVLTTGDNIYENGESKYFDSRFFDVYRDLLDQGVRFHASLGNHDMRYRDGKEQVLEKAFGYEGRQEEYEFEAGPMLADGKRLARFICLNTNRWDEEGGAALEKRRDELRERLERSDDYRWNFAYFHHPLYSFVKSGFLIPRGHGANSRVRELLEPEFVDRIDAVFAGHDHFYQKIRPQKGIHHFITGGAGKLRRGAKRTHPDVEYAEVAFHFMDFSLSEQALHYQSIDHTGDRIHFGRIQKREASRLVEIGA